MISIIDKYEGASWGFHPATNTSASLGHSDRNRPFLQASDPAAGSFGVPVADRFTGNDATGGNANGSAVNGSDHGGYENNNQNSNLSGSHRNGPVKRIVLGAAVIIIALLLFGIGFLLGKSKAPEAAPQTSFYARIIAVDSNVIHVTGIEENDINHRGEAFLSFQDPTDAGAIVDPSGRALSRSVLQPEVMIQVWYEGPVMESYPVQIQGVTRIMVLDE